MSPTQLEKTWGGTQLYGYRLSCLPLNRRVPVKGFVVDLNNVTELLLIVTEKGVQQVLCWISNL